MALMTCPKTYWFPTSSWPASLAFFSLFSFRTLYISMLMFSSWTVELLTTLPEPSCLSIFNFLSFYRLFLCSFLTVRVKGIVGVKAMYFGHGHQECSQPNPGTCLGGVHSQNSRIRLIVSVKFKAQTIYTYICICTFLLQVCNGGDIQWQ